MANYRVGDIIRLTRIASGLTQEQLSENICSVETMSRIEKTWCKKRYLSETDGENEPESGTKLCHLCG